MAKDEKGGKIRFVLFEMEGSDETLRESVRTAIAAAMGRGIVPPRTLNPSAKAKALPNGNSTQDGQVVEAEDEEYIEVEEATTTPSRPKRERNRTYRRLEILDIDLDAGDVPFEEYCRRRNPENDSERYLVVAGWLKHYAGINAIGPDHINTCYRRMGWGVPKDVGSTFRNSLRRNGNNWFRRAGKGLYELTHIGENELTRMS